MKPVVSFVGNSGSGKTTLLERVVPELKQLGYRVAIVKHTSHSYDIDKTGKDTWRLAEAGGDIVAISSPERMALFERVDSELALPEIAARFGDRVDIVLAEGYKGTGTAKILVTGTEADKESPDYSGETLATVSARQSPSGALQFDPADVTRITKLILRHCGVEKAP
jgi:molybdopterin-guanine dinucleotide biosynthesis protein B